MPDIDPAVPGVPKTVVKMKPGETVAFCRCYESKKFPMCDGSHKALPGKGPVVVSVPPPPTPA